MASRGESPRMHFVRIILCKYWLIFAFTRCATAKCFAVSSERGTSKGRGEGKKKNEQTDGKRDPRECSDACILRGISFDVNALEYNGTVQICGDYTSMKQRPKTKRIYRSLVNAKKLTKSREGWMMNFSFLLSFRIHKQCRKLESRWNI